MGYYTIQDQLKDPEIIKKKIKGEMNHFEMALDMLKEPIAILKKWDGKQINKRMVTFVGNELSGAYKDKYSLWFIIDRNGYTRLEISKKGEYSEKIAIHFKYQEKEFHYDDFMENIKGYIEFNKFDYRLKILRVDEYCRKWNEHIQKLIDINKKAEENGLKYYFDIESR